MPYEDLKTFLRSVEHSKAEQERLRERIAELESRCFKMTASLSGMPGGGSSDKERQWAALADEENRLSEQLAREIERARRVERFLDRIPVKLYRDALMYRYVNLKTVPGVTEALAKTGKRRSQRQVERIIASAERMAEELWRKDHEE